MSSSLPNLVTEDGLSFNFLKFRYCSSSSDIQNPVLTHSRHKVKAIRQLYTICLSLKNADQIPLMSTEDYYSKRSKEDSLCWDHYCDVLANQIPQISLEIALKQLKNVLDAIATTQAGLIRDQDYDLLFQLCWVLHLLWQFDCYENMSPEKLTKIDTFVSEVFERSLANFNLAIPLNAARK